MADEKPIGVDNPGFAVLRDAILTLLNQFPGLDGLEITYGVLGEDSGISMEPESGALVYSNRPDILGYNHQACQFPFFVVRRSAATDEYQKLRISQFLDTLGSWLCREPVTIDGSEYQLSEYPALTGGRRIIDMERSNSYALEANENKTQDWVIRVTANYTHDFKKP